MSDMWEVASRADRGASGATFPRIPAQNVPMSDMSDRSVDPRYRKTGWRPCQTRSTIRLMSDKSDNTPRTGITKPRSDARVTVCLDPHHLDMLEAVMRPGEKMSTTFRRLLEEAAKRSAPM